MEREKTRTWKERKHKHRNEEKKQQRKEVKKKTQKERKMKPVRERLLYLLSTLLQWFLSSAQGCWCWADPTFSPSAHPCSLTLTDSPWGRCQLCHQQRTRTNLHEDRARSQNGVCCRVYCALWDGSFDKNIKLRFEFSPAATALGAENTS